MFMGGLPVCDYPCPYRRTLQNKLVPSPIPLPRSWYNAWGRGQQRSAKIPAAKIIMVAWFLTQHQRKRYGSLLVTWYKKYFSARNIFFSARNIFLRKKYIFLRKKYIFSARNIFFSARNIFFSARNIFFRKKYFFPLEIFFSARNIFFSTRNIFFSARNIFFRKK